MLAFFVNTNEIMIMPMINALIFALLGMVLFGLAFFIIVMICPFSIRKEIEEDQNTSLGIVIGSVIIGIALILAAAIHS
jgi:uncharacterized membrane protein YjfL (UPF0719 family)